MEQIPVCVKCNTEAELEEAIIEIWWKGPTYHAKVTKCCQAGYDIVDKPRDKEQMEDDHQDYLLLVAKEERNEIYDE